MKRLRGGVETALAPHPAFGHLLPAAQGEGIDVHSGGRDRKDLIGPFAVIPRQICRLPLPCREKDVLNAVPPEPGRLHEGVTGAALWSGELRMRGHEERA